MKHILFTIAFSTLYSIAYSQSQVDYESVMNKFKYFYNSNQLDSLCYLHSGECYWNLEDIERGNVLKNSWWKFSKYRLYLVVNLKRT